MAYVNAKGQVAPAATTLTTLYTVPAGYQALISTCKVANRGVAGTFRISIAPAGAADDVSHYQNYDLAIAGSDTFSANEGWLLSATDVIRCYASHANMTFTAFVRLEPL